MTSHAPANKEGKTTMMVTYRMLVSKGACVAQRDKFCQLYPNGVIITRELCVKHATDFDWNWAARNLLSGSARDAYLAVRAVIDAAYVAAMVSADATYAAGDGPYSAYDAIVAYATAKALAFATACGCP
jgi:hypothetical protein